MTRPDELAPLREEMRRFVQVSGFRAPLYARLALGLSESDEALTILAEAPPANRITVTLFAAIQFLLLAEPDEPLAAWYPNLSVEPRRDDPPKPPVSSVCGGAASFSPWFGRAPHRPTRSDGVHR